MKFEEAITDNNFTALRITSYNKFKGMVNKEDFNSLALEALWEACNTHDPSKSKLTTYFVSLLNWKICNFLRDKNRENNRVKKFREHKANQKESFNYTFLTDILDLFDQKDKYIFEQRFIYKKTVNELAEELKTSTSNIRSVCSKIKEKIKESYLDCV